LIRSSSSDAIGYCGVQGSEVVVHFRECQLTTLNVSKG
jgi:hypothetical protein